MPTWSFDVDGQDVTDEVLRGSVRITSTGYRGLATASFSVRDLDGTIDIAPEAEVVITRDGEREFGGLVRDRGRTLIGDTGKRMYQLTCQDFSSLLSDDVVDGTSGRRRTDETDKARITWLLSNWGTKGITVGDDVQAIETSMEPGDYRGLTLAEALDRIGEETGATWYVDAHKRLHYFRTETSAAPFDFSDDPNGTTLRGYRGFQLPDDTAGLVNAVWVRGRGIQGWRTDSDSITAYGRREGVLRAPRVRNQRQLTRRGDAYLRRHARPRQSGRLQTWEAGGLRAGMLFDLTNAAWGISGESFRTQEVTLTITAPNGESMYDVSFGDGRMALGTGGAGKGAGAVARGEDGEIDVVDRIVQVTEAGPNLVPDSSGELGSGWSAGGFTVGYANLKAKHGLKTFRAAPSGATVGQLISSDFIPVDRTLEHWISVFSWMTAYTSGTGRMLLLEYSSGGSLLATNVIAEVDAVEGLWTRHALRLGDVETDEGPAFHASTTKVKLAADSAGAAATFTWELDAWQVERSDTLTAYAPAWSELAPGSIDITKFADTIRPVAIVATLPSLPDPEYPIGATVVLTSDGKLYRNVANAWTAAVPAVDISGQLIEAQIADAAITTAKFASGIRPVGVGSSLPSLPSASWPAGATFALTTDGKLYRSTGSAWTAAVPAADVTGTLAGSQIADGALSMAKFASGIRPPRVVGSLPSLPDAAYPEGDVVYLTTDDKLYRSTGSAWSKAVDGGDIVAGSIVAGKIAAGAIGADEIAAGAIIASKLAITDFENLAVDGGFENVEAGLPTGWSSGADWNFYAVAPRSGSRHLWVAAGASNRYIGNDLFVHCKPGDKFYGEGYVRSDATGRSGYGVMQVWWYDEAKTFLSLSNGNAITTTTTYSLSSVTGTAPAGASFARLVCAVSAGNGWWLFDDCRMRRLVGATIIEDGAITTAKVAAGAITANEIAADTITAAQIAAGAISASEIAAGAVSTAKLAAGAVTANEIAAGAVSTAKLAAGAVTTNELGANAVTAAKIAADTITAGQIAAGAIGASEIAASAVSADKIATGSLHVGLFGSDARGLIPNGGFEQEAATGSYGETVTGWSAGTSERKLTSTAGEFRSTAQALVVKKINGGTGTFQRSDYVPVGLNRRIRVKAWVRGKAGNGSGTVAVGVFTATRAGAFVGSSFGSGVTVGTNTSWQEITATISLTTATVGKIAFALSLGSGFATNDEIFVDDVLITYADEDVSHAAGAVTIDSNGVTITNGKLVVSSDGGGTVIIDGTSMMFKAAAIGTLSVTGGSNTFTSSLSAALTGMGTLSAAPGHLSFLSPGNLGTDSKFLGSLAQATAGQFTAGSSGGSPTNNRVTSSYHAHMFTYLNGSNYAVVGLTLANGNAGSVTVYGKYYVLKEAAM